MHVLQQRRLRNRIHTAIVRIQGECTAAAGTYPECMSGTLLPMKAGKNISELLLTGDVSQPTPPLKTERILQQNYKNVKWS